MVDERNEDQYDEEGEYHFSDDQNFDADENEAETEAPPAPVAKQNILTRLMPYRRMIIGVVGFFVIIFIIYSFISPKTPLESEITQVAAPPSTQPVPQQETVLTPAAPSPQPQPSSAMMALQQPAPQAATQMPAPAETTVTPAPALMPVSAPAPAAAPDVSTAQLRGVVDRLSALEEQNAKLVNLLQTQVAQKMADYDAENNTAQEKVRALNKRMANMEASLNKMAQLMKEGSSSHSSSMTRSSDMSGMPMPRVQQPKIVYTVQAIIPGRAWLKNDGGDTVTVAEGDILKDFGRIVKIDPYDGIVEIDTGSKIIALSYGASGD